MARRYLHEPVRITLGGPRTPATTPRWCAQSAYVVSRQHKPAALGRVLDIEAPAAAIVFCGTRNEVDELTEVMNGRGYRAEALHGGMTQEQRDRVMDRLRSETADLLVATDVAATGLDIDHLTHVINYDVPSAPESYVHRIGRVGRAGREGVAITLVEPRQHRLLRSIERHTGQRMEIEAVPTVADLRARRLELTREALHERLLADDDLDRLRGRRRVAQRRVRPDGAHPGGGGARPRRGRGWRRRRGRLPEVRLHEDGPARGRKPKGRGKGAAGGGRPQPSSATARIYVGAGRDQGIRPKDLVGAIANESGLTGAQIGNIEITPNFSLVEVPKGAADEVIAALRDTRIKGRRATVRPDRHTKG
jgi:ATP-dependent RNA helicase DeaD